LKKKERNTRTNYSVITGDIIGSSLIGKKKGQLLSQLKKTFNEINAALPDAAEKPFEIFRGDSFQSVIKQPGKSVLIGILIRAKLRSITFGGTKSGSIENKLDARIAIGIGKIGFEANKVIESDGEAFSFSGKLLDEITKERQNLKVKTPWKDINSELDVECYYIDTIINKWTMEQAEAAYLKLLKDETQQLIAKKLKISQPAVRKRIIGANLKSIELFTGRFENLIESKL
jgi:hypothetical protein